VKFVSRVFDSVEVLRPESRRIKEVGDIEAQSQVAVAAQFVIEVERLKVSTGTVDACQAVLIGPFNAGTQRQELLATSS
jgi:hypothetical protein